MKWMLAALCACFVPGGCVILAITWWRHRALERERHAIAAQIQPPVPRYGTTTEAERSSIRAGANRRRQAADDKKRDAARIQSGEPVEERLRLVR